MKARRVEACRTAAHLLIALGAAGCASAGRPAAVADGPQCEFVIHNRTPSPIEVRLVVSNYSTTSIGALNVGEQMTHRVPCTQQGVVVFGVEIPWQTGAPRRFGAVVAEATLEPGARPRVTLHWP